MADLTEIQAALPMKIIGTDATGLETNPVNATANGLKVDGSSVVQPVSGSITASADIATSYSPDYSSYVSGSSNLLVDSSGRLETHSTITTDEGSFRDDFSGSSLTSTLTGTLTFTNGSTAVTGSGTTFTSLKYYDYVKLAADANSAFAQIATIVSDTSLILTSPYSGTGGTGTANYSSWIPSIGTGTSLTVGSGVVSLISGTTNGSAVSITRRGDYLPWIAYTKFSISQRIANQTTIWGFTDTFPSQTKQALFSFSGTDATKVTCISSFSSLGADQQSTTVTLPGAATTAATNKYEIDISANQVSFLINGTVVAQHKDHLPGPYDSLNIVYSVTNSAVVTTTTMAVDYLFFSNLDEVEITNNFNGEPLPTILYGNSVLTGLPVPINTDSSGNLVVTAVGGFGAAFTFGDVTTSSTATTAVRRTAYTEQSSGAQRSIKSASANDTAAGTGARQVTITYLDSTGAGPYTEVVTLNGTTAVNTVATNICYIEKVVVTSAGSGGSNVGILSLFTAAAGGGSAFVTISAGDNQTFFAHHYVPILKTCNITGISTGSTSSVAGNGSTFSLKSLPIGVAGATETQVSDFVWLYGQSSTNTRVYSSPIVVTGPARLTLYSTSQASASVTYRGSFDYFQV